MSAVFPQDTYNPIVFLTNNSPNQNKGMSVLIPSEGGVVLAELDAASQIQSLN